MNNQKQNKSPGIRGKVRNRMDFYVPVGFILVELDSSNDDGRIETRNSTENEVSNLIDTLGEITE
jgi:hypothetical protein